MNDITIIPPKQISRNEFEVEINNNILQELNDIKYKYIPEESWPILDKEKYALIKRIDNINNALSSHNQNKFINNFDDLINSNFEPNSKLSQATAETLMELKEDIHKLYKEIEIFFKKANSIFIGSSISSLVDTAEELLIEKATNIYQRCRKLVCVVKISSIPKVKKDKIKRYEDPYVITIIDHLYLTEILTRLASWSKYDGRSDSIKVIDNCPEKIAKHLISRPHNKLRVLNGFVNAPTMRPDGTIFDEPGYDPDTGLLFISENNNFEKIPDNPTKEDAIESLKILKNIFRDFPFENPLSESIAISWILTVAARKALPTVPINCFSSPMPGTGKTLISDLVSLIITGKRCAVMAYTGNEAEDEKRLFSSLMAGDQIINYDNIDKDFSSSIISSLVTAEYFQGRKLGVNENHALINNLAISANGNNLIISGDMPRRTLLSIIDANVENPENRKLPDIKTEVIENRSKIIKAIYTILIAYKKAGSPNKVNLGSFEDWSDLIPSALCWLGLPNPCDSIKRIKAEDPNRIAISNLLESWFDVFESKAMPIKKAIKFIIINPDKENKHSRLKESFICLAPGKNELEIDTTNLGRKMREYKNNIIGNYRLETDGFDHGSVCWRVLKIGKSSQSAD